MKTRLFSLVMLVACLTAAFLFQNHNAHAQNGLTGFNQTTTNSNATEITATHPGLTANPLPSANSNASFANYDPDDIDYDSITKRDQLPKLIIPGYDRYSAARALDKKLSHEEAMKKAFSSDDARERWSDIFKRIYEGK